MALFLEIETTLEMLPELHALLDGLDQTFGTTIQLNTTQALDLDCGVRKVSWCPWPDEQIEVFVAGATTRGADVLLEKRGRELHIRVVLKALATWTDWQLGVEAACALCDLTQAPGVLVGDDEDELRSPEELRRMLLDDDDAYWKECEGGAHGIRRAIVEQGEIVRIGGPAGLAAIGPRTWARLGAENQDGEALSELLLGAMRSSIEAHGFEGFHLANPMILDGRSGQSVVALLVAPDRPTLLRDAEFVLLSDNLESAAGAPLYLLPATDIETAFPGLVSWLDDRNCALAAIPQSSWARRLEEIRPLLSEVDEFLDRQPAQMDSPERDDLEHSVTVRRWLPRKFW